MGGSCCSGGGESSSQRLTCPGCGGERKEVERKTILQQLHEPWRVELAEQRYGFCDGTECGVVYFGENGATIESEALRVVVGQKLRGESDPLCYCYAISYGQATADPTLKPFVIEQTAKQFCSCDSRNPSGRCCLGDFPGV